MGQCVASCIQRFLSQDMGPGAISHLIVIDPKVIFSFIVR